MKNEKISLMMMMDEYKNDLSFVAVDTDEIEFVSEAEDKFVLKGGPEPLSSYDPPLPFVLSDTLNMLMHVWKTNTHISKHEDGIDTIVDYLNNHFRIMRHGSDKTAFKTTADEIDIYLSSDPVIRIKYLNLGYEISVEYTSLDETIQVDIAMDRYIRKDTMHDITEYYKIMYDMRKFEDGYTSTLPGCDYGTSVSAAKVLESEYCRIIRNDSCNNSCNDVIYVLESVEHQPCNHILNRLHTDDIKELMKYGDMYLAKKDAFECELTGSIYNSYVFNKTKKRG